VLAISALTTGLFLLPGGLLMGFLGPIVGRLYDRLGARALIVPGTVVVSLALWGMGLFSESMWPGWILIDNVALSLGLAFIFTPLFTVAMSSVPPQLYSHGSAVIGTVQQLAGAAGTALFVTIMTLVVAGSNEAPVPALASGAQAAFMCGAIVATLALIPAALVRQPATAATKAAELQP
jgi:DHA2 family lincomycin resistance protein-like MFS transporter